MKLDTIKLCLYGFRKVKLNDSKGILNRANNHKWVKQIPGRTITILPSGTRIDQCHGSKCITKADKSVIIACDHGDEFVLKKGYSRTHSPYEIQTCFVNDWKTFTPKSSLQRLAQEKQKAIEALRQKRLAFIENFKNKFDRKLILGENGAKTKVISDKESGKTISWWRKNEKKEVIQGHINYAPDGLIKELTIETPAKTVTRTKALNYPFAGVNTLEVNTLTIDKTNGIIECNSKILPWEKLR